MVVCFCEQYDKNPALNNMMDQEIITSLIAHDPKVTAQFFFKDCRPLFNSIIRRVFGNQIVDYDEIISELYVLLMENDARKLRTFKHESTLFQWLKTIAVRHCLELKRRGKVIDNESQEPLVNSGKNLSYVESSQAKMDVESLLRQMNNQRYALVIHLLMIEEKSPEEVAKQLSITVANLYNIKRRAMKALVEVALKDKRSYERQYDNFR